jgi:amino acid transporter
VDIVKENINNIIIEIIGGKVQQYIISFIFILGILAAIFSFIIANKNISYLLKLGTFIGYVSVGMYVAICLITYNFKKK